MFVTDLSVKLAKDVFKSKGILQSLYCKCNYWVLKKIYVGTLNIRALVRNQNKFKKLISE